MKKWSIWILLVLLAVIFLVWIIEIFRGNDPPDKEHNMSKKLIEELNEIDRNAEEMAESVLKSPLLRSDLKEKSEYIRKGISIIYLAQQEQNTG